MAYSAEGPVTTGDFPNILLVCARSEGRFAVESALEGVDGALARAASGEEALRRLAEADFAVILLDVELPDMSGLKLAGLIRSRERDRRAPIMFLGVGEAFPVEEAYALGAVDHLPAPLVPTVLRSKAAMFVDLFRRERAARAGERSVAAGVGPDYLWRTTLASIGDAVIATDADGRVSFLNPVAERLTGWPLAEALGRPIGEVFQIVNETTRELVENPALRVLETSEVATLANHTILIARDGAERPIDDSAAPIQDGSGAVVGAVLVFRDVTERKLAESARAHLAAIVESSHDAIVGKDLDGTIRSWNGGAVRIFGYTAEEAIGRSITLIVPKDRLDEEWGILERLKRGERVDHFETRRVRKDGALVDVALTISPIRDSEGRIIGASKVARDVTESKRAERALAASLQAGEVGTYYWDIQADRVTGDRNFVAIFGVLADDQAAAPVVEVMAGVHPEDRDRVAAEIWRTLADDSPFRSEYRVVGAAGERWLLSRGAVERDARGEPIGWGGVVVDITERKRIEEALAASLARLDYAVRASGIGFWYCDLPFDELRWDERVKAHFHLPPDARVTIGTFYERLHPDDREPTRAAIERSIAERSGCDIHYRTIDPATGAEKWVRAIGRAYYDETGAPRRFDGVSLDVTEQRRAQERLRDSEHRFRSLFESMDDGYCVIEPLFDSDGRPVDYRYLLANPAMEQQTGITDIVGKTARELMPNHESHWIEGYAHVALTGELFRKTDRVADLGRWFEVSAFRIGSPDDRRVGVLFNDVTDRKLAEALLREKDERLSLLVDQAKDYAMIVTNRHGRVVEWSGGAESITGFAPEEIVGRPADVIFTDEDRAAGAPTEEMERAAREGRAEHTRWHVRKDGNQFFAEGVMVPLWGDNKALRGFGKVFRDVTDRKRAEDSVRFLADAGASLAELVDYSSTLNRIANLAVGAFADWCVVDMINENGERERLAVTSSEAADARAARFAETESRAIEVDMGLTPRAPRTIEPEVVTDLTAVDPTTAPRGSERMARLRELGIRSYLRVPLRSRGRIIGGMTFLSSSPRRRFGPEELRIAQNLAERVTIAIENARLYRELQEQDRRKDEFLATLAHELRNPLAPVRNGLQLLRMSGVKEDMAERTLAMMDRQLGHITHLVDDLMDVARVSSGKVVLRMERAPLRAIVDAAVETSRQMIETANHELVLRTPREALVVEADRTRLVQVLANLLNNAAKYTPPGGRIELSVKREGDHAAIRIADNGVGIPSEMLPKVFEMFNQVGASLDRSQGGLGIGLTLVKRLIEMHGGTVEAESAGPGMGSAFTVRMPLAVEEGTALESAPQAADGSVGRALDILVVDDNRDSASTLAMLLTIRGHRVKTAHDGPEALRLLSNYRPRLILLDLGLPGMSGYEVAQRVRESTELREVTLAALTGWGQAEDRRRTREAGFDHHLVKPAEPEELDRIVREIVEAKP